MLKKFFTRVLFVAAALTVGLTSCDDDDDFSVSEGQVVGLWELDLANCYVVYGGQRFGADAMDYDAEDGERYLFAADHTYTTYSWYNQTWREDYSERGTWSLSGNTITISFDEDDEVSPATVTEISANRMVLRSRDSEYDDDLGKTISWDVYTVLKRVVE